MPAIVDPEEREKAVGSKKRLRSDVADFVQMMASGATEEEENQSPLVIKIKELMEKGETTTTESRREQTVRIDTTIKFKRFTQDVVPVLVRTRALKRQPPGPPPSDPLDYSDVPALIERLVAFLVYEAHGTKGRAENGVIAKRSLLALRDTIINIAIHHVQQHETLETVKPALARLLTCSADGKQGLYYKVCNQAAAIVNALNIQPRSKEVGLYSRPEVSLLLEDIFRRLPTRADADALLQKALMVQICFVAGLRIGSIVACDDKDEDRLGLRQTDVYFETLEPGAWSTHVRITHFKGSNKAADRIESWITFTPVLQPNNLYLEPTIPLLILMIKRGALRAHGKDGPVIRSVEQLVRSDAHRFVVVGNDEPIFRYQSKDGSVREHSSASATHLLSTHTIAVGLPYASFHRLRHDFATQLKHLFGDETAKMLMGHGMKKNTLNLSYTQSAALYDLMRIRAGETDGGGLSSMQKWSLYEASKLVGFAARSVAATLDSGEAADGQVPAGRTSGALVKAGVPTTGKAPRRKLEEIVRYAREVHPPFKKAHDEFLAQAEKLGNYLGIEIVYGQGFQPTVRAVQQAFGGRPQEDRERARDMLYKLEELYKAAKDATVRANVMWSNAQRNKRAKVALSSSSAAISVDNIKEAGRRLQEAPSILPVNAKEVLASASEDARAQPSTSSLHQVRRLAREAADIELPRIDGNPDETMVLDEEVLETIERERDFQQGDGSDVDPLAVIPGNLGVESADRDQHNHAAVARVVMLEYLERVFDNNIREDALEDFISEAGFCPLCPFGRNESFITAGSASIGLLDKRGSAFKAHMAQHHPNELTALRLGFQLNPGVLQCPLIPFANTSVWLQNDDMLARYLAPALPEVVKTDVDEVLFAKYLHPRLNVDEDDEPRKEFEDRVIGKLFASSVIWPRKGGRRQPGESKPTDRQNITAQQESWIISHEWPTTNKVGVRGPFKRDERPLKPVHSGRLLAHGDETSVNARTKVDPEAVRAHSRPSLSMVTASTTTTVGTARRAGAPAG